MKEYRLYLDNPALDEKTAGWENATPVGSGRLGAMLYGYVKDEKDRTFPTKLYRFPMPESELNSNSLVNQYEEWR